MKKNATQLLFVILSALLFTSCIKSDYVVETEEQQWMRTHDKGTVAYVDHRRGNYIIETYQGYAVVEAWGGVTPMEYDTEFAWFSNRGMQTTYNLDGNYFTKIKVIDSWLSWSDALYVLDNLQ